LAAVGWLAVRLPHIGDDCAVVEGPGGDVLLLAADTVVEGVHADLGLTSEADFGWKALAANLSDVAAMGGRPLHALVTVVLPTGRSLEAVYEGLLECSAEYGVPIVGGDLSAGPALVVTVSVTGTVDGVGDPVRRSGARPGDGLYVTGPLGASAAGLRGNGPAAPHARPVPRLAEGVAARQAGATAMLDLSDGLLLDVRRLADASGVGVVIDSVPVAAGATEEDALGGGEDFELLAASPVALRGWVRIGACTADPQERRLGGDPLPEGGWEHRW
jgi:thiamine-monophosphate kinase